MVSQATLVCHRGAREVSRDELARVSCPEAQGRWRPVPHNQVLSYAEDALTAAGYATDRLSIALSGNNARFFATLTLRSPLADGVNLAVGLRSSTDKTISLQWCCGSRVFVCDNLAFSAQTMIARKHTRFGVERYQEAIARVIADLGEYQEYKAARIEQMHRTELSDEQAESILLRAFEKGIIGPRALPIALKQWRAPSFPEFSQSRTAWRLYNALTFALGRRARTNPQAHAQATIRLGALVLPKALPPANEFSALPEAETILDQESSIHAEA